jgi:hypothetical protein
MTYETKIHIAGTSEPADVDALEVGGAGVRHHGGGAAGRILGY